MQKRNFLFSIPRSASNLLVRILNLENQPDILAGGRDGGYFFFDVQEKIFDMNLSDDVRTWTAQETTIVQEAIQTAVEAMTQHIDTAEQQGKGVFIKEHAIWVVDPVSASQSSFKGNDFHAQRFTAGKCGLSYPGGGASSSNISIFSDAFLQTLCPTFLIRHPALMIPSYVRAGRDMGGEEMIITTECSLRWSRQLYDWFTQNKPGDDSSLPVVLDAEDIMSQPTIVKKYSQLVGLDTSALQFTWDKRTDDEINVCDPLKRRMTDTLNASSGIISTTRMTGTGLQIDKEVEKWKHEFGADLAARIEESVRASLDDYEYLRTKRLT